MNCDSGATSGTKTHAEHGSLQKKTRRQHTPAIMVNNRSTDRNGSLSVFGFLVDDFLRRWRTSFAMVKVCVCMRGPAPSPCLLLLGGSFLRFTNLCLQRLRLVSRGTKRIARTVCSSRSCSRFALVYLYPCAWLASTTALLSANVMYNVLVCYAEYFMT